MEEIMWYRRNVKGIECIKRYIEREEDVNDNMKECCVKWWCKEIIWISDGDVRVRVRKKMLNKWCYIYYIL
jgi:hypothetical protein